MPSQPNIVWIYCDELRADALGCYGNRPGPWPEFQRQTPNLDALADSGALFERCYCNSPVCVSSRVCTLTGLYCEDTGVYHNEGDWPDFHLPRELTTFPQTFAAAGYETANFGKLHVARGMDPFDHHDPAGGGMQPVTQGGEDTFAPRGVSTRIGGRFAGERFPAEQLTDNALVWMDRREGPFLARLSYLQPHTPVYPPAPFDSLYAPELFPDRFSERGETSDFERRFAEVTNAANFTPRQIQLAQAYYYGLVAWVDSQVGRVLQFLAEKGRDRETIVVFTADHGASLGEGGNYAKHTFAPQVHRVPLLIAWPGAITEGQRRTDICEGLDLARTLLGLCGVEVSEDGPGVPPPPKGRNLFAEPAPEAVYATIGFGLEGSKAYPNARGGTYVGGASWPRRACVRTDRHRLDRNVKIDGQAPAETQHDVFLADSLVDPAEATNFAADPAHLAHRRRLEALLDDHLADAVEPDPAVVGR